MAAINAVRDPTMVTTIKAMGACSNRGDVLISKKTPAVTMVAAWIKADTGVGISNCYATTNGGTATLIADRTFSSTL